MAQASADGRVVQVLTKSIDKDLRWLVELFFVAVDNDIGAEQQLRKARNLGPEANIESLAKLSAINVEALGRSPGQVVAA